MHSKPKFIFISSAYILININIYYIYNYYLFLELLYYIFYKLLFIRITNKYLRIRKLTITMHYFIFLLTFRQKKKNNIL